MTITYYLKKSVKIQKKEVPVYKMLPREPSIEKKYKLYPKLKTLKNGDMLDIPKYFANN